MKTDVQQEIVLEPNQDSFVLLILTKNDDEDTAGVLTLEGRVDRYTQCLTELYATEASSARTRKIL